MSYRVTVTISSRTRGEIMSRLQTAFGASIAFKAQITRQGAPPDWLEACSVNRHFGCVHWTDKDLQHGFDELYILPTPALVKAVKASYAVRHISDRMIELGWEVIEQAILDQQG